MTSLLKLVIYFIFPPTIAAISYASLSIKATILFFTYRSFIMVIHHKIPLWKHAPFIRILIPFSMGLIIGWYCELAENAIRITSIACLLLVFVAGFLPLQVKYYYGYLQGLLINFLLLSTGVALLFTYKATNLQNWIGQRVNNNQFLIASVTEMPTAKPRSYKLIVRAKAIVDKENVFPTNGLILLYMQADSNVRLLKEGDVILFKSSLQKIRNSGNPGSFDYRSFLSYSNIYFQGYTTSKGWVLLDKKKTFSIQNWLQSIQINILATIKKYIPDEKEQGLAEALLIGYKTDLDRDLLQAYSNTGVVHVIAISGLHLGLIYWLLNLILFPFRKKKSTKLPSAILTLLCLWLFSLISGASPSVLRSAVMFSFIIIGNCGSRKISVYNSLAASAFFLLCFNPCWLWDVGFQLSYIAVLSIVVFMKPIYQLFSIRNKLLDLLWQLSAVTFAAQVLTTPLSIFHFHQFPTVFLFTNLIAVPLSSLILLGEVLLISISSLSSFSFLLGKGLQWLIHCMNSYVQYMNEFPFSTLNSLSISLAQCFLLYGIISFAFLYYQSAYRSLLIACLFCVMLFFGLRTISFTSAQQQALLIVYNVPKKKAIDIAVGQQVAFIGDDSVLQTPKSKQYYLYPTRTLFRLNQEFRLNSSRQIALGGKKILFLDQPSFNPSNEPLQVVDIVILSNNPRFQLEDLQRTVVFNQLVLDASNNVYSSRRWKSDCEKDSIPCHAVSIDGAFVMKSATLTFAPR